MNINTTDGIESIRVQPDQPLSRGKASRKILFSYYLDRLNHSKILRFHFIISRKKDINKIHFLI